MNATNNHVETLLVKHDDKVTQTFMVYGNCSKCEKTIEGSLKNVKGIAKANWNKETKAMVVSYDTATISLYQIQKYIASVGYDNIKYEGDDANYAKLPE